MRMRWVSNDGVVIALAAIVQLMFDAGVPVDTAGRVEGEALRMPTVFITGASRGIGMAFATQYAAEGWRVLAGCRTPEGARSLAALAGDVSALPLDVTSNQQVEDVAQSLQGEQIDLLINNAGIARRGQPAQQNGMDDVDLGFFAEILDVNVMGLLRVTRALAPMLRAGTGKRVVVLSSRMGSIALNSGGSYPYRVSKAGANMVMSCLAWELAPDGITVVALHPGWVKTDMGGPGADLTPERSVADMRRIIAGLTPAVTGAFISHNGTPIPW